MAVEGTIAEIKGQYEKAGKKIIMGIFGDPTAAIQPVSTLTGGNFYFDRQRAVFEIPLASDINEQETAHRLFDLLNSAGLTVSLFVIENDKSRYKKRADAFYKRIQAVRRYYYYFSNIASVSVYL